MRTIKINPKFSARKVKGNGILANPVLLKGDTKLNFILPPLIQLQIIILGNKLYFFNRGKERHLSKDIQLDVQVTQKVIQNDSKLSTKLNADKNSSFYKKSVHLNFTPTNNNFDISTNIFVLHESEYAFYVDNDINLDKLLQTNSLENIKGKINVNYKVLLYSNAQITVVPQFRILPAGIEAEHGLVIYGPQNIQEFYLNNRAVSLRQILKQNLIKQIY